MEESHTPFPPMLCDGILHKLHSHHHHTTTTKPLRSQRPPLSLPETLYNNHTSKRARNDQKLVIIVSPTSKRNKLLRNAMLTRLASTLRLVAQPLVWVVVEPKPSDPEASQILRKTGIMYRHVVSDEDFIDEDAEIDHQRNLTLNHIEHHRLSGVVHFAGLSNVYDLSFFQEIRAIVSILWDPERWGRRTFPTQQLSTDRNYLKYRWQPFSCNLARCDPTAKRNYHLYCDIVSFDTTYSTNSDVYFCMLIVLYDIGDELRDVAICFGFGKGHAGIAEVDVEVGDDAADKGEVYGEDLR
ncbi:hypothetical protein SASPL_135975 [Salvia splendens]|uniref:Glycosyltransferases n=1 Tax=Salvia splendens TaxID=180675 RepID=A0A8X8WZ24_SALSN|nr:hypothetical protein SASPL_135975 [Salvia splendens]